MKKLLMCMMLFAASSPIFAQENANLAFVYEFIGILGKTENIRSITELKLKENNGNKQVAAAIENCMQNNFFSMESSYA